jgi:hypothetical protein
MYARILRVPGGRPQPPKGRWKGGQMVGTKGAQTKADPSRWVGFRQFPAYAVTDPPRIRIHPTGPNAIRS